MKRSRWQVYTAILLALGVLAVLVVGSPRRSARPLDISHNGVHAPYNVRNSKHQLMLYNFRAVEPGVLYRGSGFPWLTRVVYGHTVKLRPVAYADGQAFQFMRAHRIHRIISLEQFDAQEFYGERGYFEYWYKQTGYPVRVDGLPVRAGHAYDLDAGPLKMYPEQDRRFGLRAAADFIELMKSHQPQDGAVYLHCDAGKDRTGVVAAAYELWRNQGVMDREKLWQQVMARYLISNKCLERDPEAARFAGGKVACKGEAQPGFVCPRWLEQLRPQLEALAQLA